jgi:hypothetical protein
MQKLGIYLMLFGIGSIILNSFGMEFRILFWLGEGYTSRIIITVVGLLLVIVGNIRANSK